VEEERERVIHAQDEEDVEGHRNIKRNAPMTDDPDASSESGRREADEESDVEAHRHSAGRNSPGRQSAP
jgi:hypothetical protein